MMKCFYNRAEYVQDVRTRHIKNDWQSTIAIKRVVLEGYSAVTATSH